MVLLPKYDKGNKTEKRWGGEGGACLQENRHTYRILVRGRNLKELDDLKNLVINGSIILKCFPNT